MDWSPLEDVMRLVKWFIVAAVIGAFALGLTIGCSAAFGQTAILYRDDFEAADFWSNAERKWDMARPKEGGPLSMSAGSENGAMVIRWSYPAGKQNEQLALIRYRRTGAANIVPRALPLPIWDYGYQSTGTRLTLSADPRSGITLPQAERRTLLVPLDNLIANDLDRDREHCEQWQLTIRRNSTGPATGELRLHGYMVLGDPRNDYFRSVAQKVPMPTEDQRDTWGTAPDLQVIQAGTDVTIKAAPGERVHLAVQGLPYGKDVHCATAADLKWASWRGWLLNDPSRGNTPATNDADELAESNPASDRLIAQFDRPGDHEIFCGGTKTVVRIEQLPLELDPPAVWIGGYLTNDPTPEAREYLTRIHAWERTETNAKQDGDRLGTMDAVNRRLAEYPAHEAWLDGALTYPQYRMLNKEDRGRLDNWVGDVLRQRLASIRPRAGQTVWLFGWDEAQASKLQQQAPLLEMGLDHGFRWTASIGMGAYFDRIRPDLHEPELELWKHWTGKHGDTFGDLIDWWQVTQRNYVFGSRLKAAGKRCSSYGRPFADILDIDSTGQGPYGRFRREVWRAYLANYDSTILFAWDDIRGAPLKSTESYAVWNAMGRFNLAALGMEAGYWDMRYVSTLQRLVDEHGPLVSRDPRVQAAQRFLDGCNSTATFRQDCLRHILVLSGA